MVRAMVARSMTRSEVMNNPKAIEAVDLEWTKLRNKKYIDPVDGKEKAGAWGESLVREFRDVKENMTSKGKRSTLLESSMHVSKKDPDYPRDTQIESAKVE